MIPDLQQKWSRNEKSFEKLVNWHGKNELILVYLEINIFNFYLNREAKSTEAGDVNDADRCLAKNCQQSGNGVTERS